MIKSKKAISLLMVFVMVLSIFGSGLVEPTIANAVEGNIAEAPFTMADQDGAACEISETGLSEYVIYGGNVEISGGIYYAIVDENTTGITIDCADMYAVTDIEYESGNTLQFADGSTVIEDINGYILSDVSSIFGDNLTGIVNMSHDIAYVEFNASSDDHTNYTGTYGLIIQIGQSAGGDVQPPVIALNGDEDIALSIGDTYVDPGVTATDDADGDLTSAVVVGGDIVDTSVAGTYTVTYNVSDAAGNAAVEDIRTVTVTEAVTLAEVTVRIEGPDYTILPETVIEVPAGSSYIDVLKVGGAIHEYTVDDSQGYISKVNGVSGDWRVNNYQTKYNNGDSLVFSTFGSERKLGQIVLPDPAEVEAGKDFTVTVADEGGALIDGAKVTYYTEENITSPSAIGITTAGTTNADGELTFGIAEAGTYYITAEKDNSLIRAIAKEMYVSEPVGNIIAPVITTSLESKTVSESEITFTASAEDDVDGSLMPVVKVFGETLQGNEGQYRASLTEGENIISIKAKDSSGNTAVEFMKIILESPDDAEGLWQDLSIHGTYADSNCEWVSPSGKIYIPYDNDIYIYDDADGLQLLHKDVCGNDIGINGIWGTSDDNIYAVADVDYYQSIILHYDGTNWTAMETDAEETLHDIYASGEDDIYAVGNDGTILHYDGLSWNCLESPVTRDLKSIFKVDGDNIYAVGNCGTILCSVDGITWNEMESNSEKNLWSVWGSSKSDIYAVGIEGTILHYDGSAWSELAMNIDVNESLYNIDGLSENDVFVTGKSGTALHFNGSWWEDISCFTERYKYKIYWDTVFADNSMYVCGNDGIFLKYNINQKADGEDIEVIDILIPETLEVGSETAIDVSIGNKGNAAAAAFDVVASINGLEIGRQSMELSSQEIKNLEFTWTPDKDGAYSMKVFVDKSTEAIEAIKKIVIGEELQYSLDVGVLTGHGKVLVQVGKDPNKLEETVDSTWDAEVDKESRVYLSAVPDEGYVFTGWSGDAAGRYDESFWMRSDVTVYANFEPRVNELGLVDIRIDNHEEFDNFYQFLGSECGESIYSIETVVKNSSNERLEEVEIKYVINGTEHIETFSINANETNNTIYYWTPEESGETDIRVMIDSDGAISENNEYDNYGETSVYVTKSDEYNMTIMTTPQVDFNHNLNKGVGPRVNGITAFSGTEMYAATRDGILLYQGDESWGDGKDGTSAQNDFMEGTVGRNIESIFGSSAQDRYAVGDDENGNICVYEYDGSQWNILEGSSLSVNLDNIWSASIDNIIGVRRDKIYQFDGSSWSEMCTNQDISYYYDVWGDSADDIFATGDDKVLHFDGTNWESIEIGIDNIYELQSIYGTSSDDLYVQYQMRDGYSGILHHDGNDWTAIEFVAKIMEDKLFVDANGDIYAVFYENDIFKYNGSDWEYVYIDENEISNIYSICKGTDEGIYITGIGGIGYIDGSIVEIGGGEDTDISPLPEKASVYIRVEGYDETFIPRTRISVESFDLEPFLNSASGSSATDSKGWGPDVLKEPRVAHAMVKVLEEEDIYYDFQDYGWSLYVAMIGGDREFNYRGTSGWMYTVDGLMPNYGCQAYTLNGGEDIVWYFGAYGFDTWMTEISSNNTEISPGEEVTVTLKAQKTDLSMFDGYGDTEEASIENAVIYVNGKPYEIDGKEVKTDENGQAVLTLNRAGAYEISAERFSGEGIRDIVRPNPVVIKVGNPGGTMSVVPVSEGDKAVVTVDEDDLMDSVEEAVDQAGDSSSDNKEPEARVILDIPETEKEEVEIVLPEGSVEAAFEAGADAIEVRTELAEFTITSETFGSESNGKEIVIDARAVSDEELEGLEGVPEGSVVIDFTAKIDGKSVEKFNEPMKVRIPYSRDVENGEAVTVYFLKDDGTVEAVGGLYDAESSMVTFLTSHFSKYFARENTREFSDLDGYGWAEDAIEIMGGKGIINGVDDTSYSPSSNITRAEFCALVARTFKYCGEGEMTFGDVTEDKWYHDCVLAAYEAGLVNGRSDEVFDPEGMITRQEMAKIISKVLEKEGYLAAGEEELSCYEDCSVIAAWAKEASAMVVREGIITGVSETEFAPEKNTTRAETAVILYRIYNLLMH